MIKQCQSDVRGKSISVCHTFGCFAQALGGGSKVCFIGTAVHSPEGLYLRVWQTGSGSCGGCTDAVAVAAADGVRQK